jgi:hypothetical protein
MEESWADTLPQPETVRLTTKIEEPGNGQISLSTIPSFKGLEADGIILFVRSPRDDLYTYLYAGASRARYLLYLVMDQKVAQSQYLPYFPRPKNEMLEVKPKKVRDN